MDDGGHVDTPYGDLESLPLHSANLLTVLDAEGVVQYESPSVERIFGFSPSELIGNDVSEFFHPEDRDRVVAAFRDLVSSSASIIRSVEYRHETADGSYVWVESVGSSEATPSDEYVINTRDISARKEREKELERKNRRLEEFASVLSHDLRNPVSVAQTRLELAREEGNDEHLASIDRSLGRIEALIDDLLNTVTDEELIVELEPVDLAEIAHRSWDNVQTRQASLETQLDEIILADVSRLQQLLENLFRNAAEHGGEDLTVIVEDTPDGFAIEDDGMGIPTDVRDQIFEAGFSTTSSGMGIGLKIVREVCDDHGWDVAVTDGDRGGARFEFSNVQSVLRENT